MRLNAKQIANYTGGTFLVDLMDPRALACDITWDSREVKPGSLFVALPGQKVDGHAFVRQALTAGALVVLVSQPIDASTTLLAREMGAAVVEVPNTYSAITDLARAWRSQLTGKVIAVTGSTGKTTTKNLVRDVLSAQFSVVATKANQNNELGVPRTLLSANPETQAVVVEMGMRGRGQISELCDFVRPDWGLITNVGECHIELLGSQENIARAKAELIEALPDGTGTAFLNASDAFTPYVADHARVSSRDVRLVAYSGTPQQAADVSAAAQVWAEDIELDDEGRARFTLHAQGFSLLDEADEASLFGTCTLSLRGLHNVHNACAAAAVGRAMGMSLDSIATALEKAQPEAGRQQVVKARRGFTVVDDSYNANPDSMRASLQMFCAMEVPGRRIAVLGDMAELGDHAQPCHEGIGRLAAQLPLDKLVCVGPLSAHIAQSAREAGMNLDKICCVDSVAQAIGEVDALVEPGDAVLAKASNCMNLKRVVEGLVN